ncbi:hypothetical protein AU381_00730 [Sinorhizobium glycinis]|uniref:Uncharacterized protein n=1 Tax=Sinorhizobium glycinis TaxID=1472378 RepID=A0A178XZ07_9HYPH|nr:hypothetical protein AU381_00730 [Sinorhizobium glycinis]
MAGPAPVVNDAGGRGPTQLWATARTCPSEPHQHPGQFAFEEGLVHKNQEVFVDKYGVHN